MELREATEKEWDVIVVGAGMGGATFGWAMARAGRSVLFLERGRNLLGDDRLAGDYPEMLARRQQWPKEELLARAGRWNRPILDVSKTRARAFIPFIGSGSGGSSSLYGAALERLFPQDFEPGRHHRREGNNLPQTWPIDHEEFQPWYRRAEALYGVAGEADPLRAEPTELPSPPPVDEVNAAIAAHLRSRGRHPYRLPTACSKGDGCRECQGFLCADFSKRDSASVCLRPAITEHGAALVSGCSVERLEAGRRRVKAVVCRDATGGEVRLRGEVVVLAAGALHTPALLLRSVSTHWPHGLANGSGQVGRNLMRHAIDLYLVRPPVEVAQYRKQLAYNDHYLTPEGKLGSVQSFGMLPPLPMVLDEMKEDAVHALPLLRPLFPLLRPLLVPAVRGTLAGKAIFAGILEDLPYQENRIEVDKAGQVRLYYRLGDDDRKRLAAFRQRVAQDFSPWPVKRLSQADNNQRIAHVCGTCRFGEDPASSVLNRWNRAHELDNLYVVDASFFPSSGGINPALTIAANALRVADALLEGRGT